MNLTKLRQELKTRDIGGKSKLRTKEEMIAVLTLHDERPHDTETMRDLIRSLLVKPPINEAKSLPSLNLNESESEEDKIMKMLPLPTWTDFDTKMIEKNPDFILIGEDVIGLSTKNEKPKEMVQLEMHKDDFERLCKIVDSYEKSRIKTREMAQMKSKQKREEKNLKLMNAGLPEMVKDPKRREHLKQMNMLEYLK